MLKNISIAILILFGMTSCNNDDNDYKSVTFEGCDGVKQIEEVTVSNVNIEAIDINNLRGYQFRASIINNTNFEIQDGSTSFIFFVNNIKLTYTTFENCSYLLSNSSCELVDFLPIGTNENFDQNPVIGCYYYKL